MRTKESACAGIGTAMVIAWFVLLGPVGFALLCGVAYAMVIQNLALGLIFGLLCVTPLVLVAMSGGLHLYVFLSKALTKQEAATADALSEP
jgi:hypothetical protein